MSYGGQERRRGGPDRRADGERRSFSLHAKQIVEERVFEGVLA